MHILYTPNTLPHSTPPTLRFSLNILPSPSFLLVSPVFVLLSLALSLSWLPYLSVLTAGSP